MLLYNETIKIDQDIENEWLQWIKSHYIPQIMGTGLFFDHHIFKLINDTDSNDPTYAIQFFAHSLNEVEAYLNDYAPKLADEHIQKYRHKHVAFRTLLQSVD